MKKLLLLVFTMFCLTVYSQSKNANFTVIKMGNKYSKKEITEAFQKAEMCGNYFQSKSNDIILDDGSVVRLFSRREMVNSSLDESCFLTDDIEIDKNIVWSILPNGYIAKGYPTVKNLKKQVANNKK
ncbi:hypothetical protein LZZ90_05640 [Flavobacterium sp. SM15]|uniref:hypothetical protein n=1 Tax=Flavobacterium sp. SM15 TaxID=2908005 RepID=UPI001EDA0209|nr:hypothetical protein [Flavobacterium sp. SM15]MCG2610983.1 hypothetical protein [Flavobacterium sp. SM15]